MKRIILNLETDSDFTVMVEQLHEAIKEDPETAKNVKILNETENEIELSVTSMEGLE